MVYCFLIFIPHIYSSYLDIMRVNPPIILLNGFIFPLREDGESYNLYLAAILKTRIWKVYVRHLLGESSNLKKKSANSKLIPTVLEALNRIRC